MQWNSPTCKNGRMRPVRSFLLPIVVTLAVFTGCQADPGSEQKHPDPSLSAPTVSLQSADWARVELPDKFNPSVLVLAAQDSMLVGGDADAEGRLGSPSLLTILDGVAATPVKARATSYYGRRAEWSGLAIDPATSTIYGFGQRRGGAHTNVRWSAWAGLLNGRLREQGQSFETFGGPKAGAIASVLVADGAPRLVGSWLSDANGLDVAVWSLTGDVWARIPSAGTVLASSDVVQNSAQAAAPWGKGVAIVGTVTRFDAGNVSTMPGLWTSPTPDGPWKSVALPAPNDVVGQGQAITCDPSGECLIIGVVGGNLRGWILRPDGTVEDTNLPPLPINSPTGLVAPTGTAGHRVIAVPSGEDASIVIVESGNSWVEVSGGPGAPVGIARVGGTIYESVHTASADGSASALHTLWAHQLD